MGCRGPKPPRLHLKGFTFVVSSPTMANLVRLQAVGVNCEVCSQGFYELEPIPHNWLAFCRSDQAVQRRYPGLGPLYSLSRGALWQDARHRTHISRPEAAACQPSQ